MRIVRTPPTLELLPRHRVTTPFRVLAADPPWRHNDALGKRGGESHYDGTLSLRDICAFPLPPLAPDVLLLLWRVHTMQAEAFAVLDAWGFRYRCELVWEKETKTGKQHFGMGRVLRNSHEVCLIASRGRPEIRTRSERSSFRAPLPCDARGRPIHSAKPDAFFSIAARLSAGPYGELFGRRKRAGWTVYGNQIAA